MKKIKEFFKNWYVQHVLYICGAFGLLVGGTYLVANCIHN